MAESLKRQEKIMHILRERGVISVSELQEKLFYSESSIRRDLKALTNLGLIIHTHGKIALNRGDHYEQSVMARSTENKQAKQKIAECASDLVKNGDTVFLDSSTTVLEMIPFLSGKSDLTIVTNGIFTLQQAYNYILDGKFFCLGGMLRKTNGSSLTGFFTQKNLEYTHCDKMFFSARAANTKFGISDTSEGEANIKQHMLNNTTLSYFLVDSSKINKCSTFLVCDINMQNKIITDSKTILEEDWIPLSGKIMIV